MGPTKLRVEDLISVAIQALSVPSSSGDQDSGEKKDDSAAHFFG